MEVSMNDDVRDHIGVFESFSPPCVVYFCVFRRIQVIPPKMSEFLAELNQNGAKFRQTTPRRHERRHVDVDLPCTWLY